jgi:hypothetical protein
MHLLAPSRKEMPEEEDVALNRIKHRCIGKKEHY